MKKILFVCLGNICRSPMAELYFNHLAKERGLSGLFHAESCATSDEEDGNPVHHGTRKMLEPLGIDCSRKRARQMRASDYECFDLIIGMDRANINSLTRFFGGDREGKIRLFMSFCGENRDIADPWFTGNFEVTFQDIKACTEGLFGYLLS